MSKKIIHLTESDLENIVRRVISEQNRPTEQIDLADTFKSGKWKMPENVKRIDDAIQKIRTFKENNKGSVIQVEINSGESRVTNYDAEVTPKISVEPGYLSQKRAETLKKYLEKNASDILQDVKIKVNDPVIGSTPYDKKLNAGEKDDEKYTKEQFSNLTIKAIGEKNPVPKIPPGCVTGLEIKVWVPSHQCNNAEFFLFANDTLLLNAEGGKTANLNNADTNITYKNISGRPKLPAQLVNPAYGYISKKYGSNKDGDIKGTRVDTFTVTNEQSKNIVKQGKGLINIWFISVSSRAHRDLPRVKIVKNGEVVYNDKPKVNDGLLLTLNGCGEKVVDNKEVIRPSTVQQERESLIGSRLQMFKEGDLPAIDDSKDDTKQMLLNDVGDLLPIASKLGDIIKKVKSLNNRREEIAYLKSINFEEVYASVSPTITKYNLWRNGGLRKNRISNKTIRNGDMYGDVRIDLKKFFDIFDVFFKTSENEYRKKGAGVSNVYNRIKDLNIS